MSEQDKNSDVVEIAKRNGDFRKNYGLWLGALLYLLSIKAVRPRSFWWKGWVALGTAVIGLWWKYGALKG